MKGAGGGGEMGRQGKIFLMRSDKLEDVSETWSTKENHFSSHNGKLMN